MTVAPHTSLRRAALLEQLIVALTSAAADSLPIRTRAPDDPTIALLDAWATTGDVLGFYLDRIAAEGYLPSATDAGSILALAGAVGYRPLPGLAAQTYLAYAMAPDPTDTAVRFDQGLLFQSVPGAGQQPQTFESAAPLVAKPSWNLLAPKAGTSPAADATSLVVASTTTNLAPNDMILMQLAPTSADASVAQATAVVAAVNVDYTNGVTDVRLQAPAQVSGGATGAAGAAGSPAVAEPAASGGSGESPAAPTDAGSAIDGLLRSGLAKAAVTLPDSANDLSRSPRTAFAGDSDTVPRILSTLQPAVAGSLYAALDSTVIGAPAVTGAARLQVNAAPFGANAPPQTVFDASGRPAGTRPWPIGDAFTLALTITRADLNALLVHVLDAARGAETGIAVTETPRIPRIDIRCATAQAAGNATIALTSGESRWSARPPGFGEVTLTRNGTTLEFASSASGEAPAVTLSLAWNETTSAFDITLVDPAPPPDDTAQSWDPRATTAFSAAIGDVQLAIGWTPPATADSTVTISLLVPLPLSDRTTLLLDAVHAGIVSGTTIVVTGADPATTVVSSVTSVSTVAAAAYGTTGSVTRLTLADPWIGSDAVLQSDLSAVTVHAQPAALPLNPTPITTPIGGSAIELSTTVAGIEPGRLIVLAGTRADLPSGASAPAAEVAMVQAVSDGAVPGDTVHSTLQLTSALAYSYERDTVSIYGNVAPAHQGATITQVLGSGQPAATPQTFTLNAGPVLADPAASASGFQSTLTVTVDGIGYAPVDRFDASTPSRSYLESTDAAGNTTISFPGPLPAGNGNVIATCRTGDGTQGNVAAGQISQLLTRPAGLSSVTNPMATAGGSGGDDQDAVRTSLPLGLGALGRIVTVADYAALAGSFAGIGKAAAAWDPQDGVTVTIAATAAEPLDPGGSLCVGVAGAIGAVADPSIAFAVVPAALLVIALTADVVNDPLVSWDETATGVEVALQGAFAYPQRSLGENVAVSDLVAAAHTVPSVLSFTVTGLALLPVGVDATALSNRLPRLLAGSVAPVATLHGALREWRLTSTRGATQAAAVAYLSPAARDIVILNQQSCMSATPDDTLYQLLPEVYRVRDATEPGSPLRTLLRAIAAQLDGLTADIAHVYDNWFIETCDDEHVELLAQLVGATLGPALPTGADAAGAALDGLWRRRQVANAIGDRRRKGTFSVLEQLAADATGWPARAVDPAATALAFWSARLSNVRGGHLLNVADSGALDLLATPLSNAAHLTDVRRPASHRTPGSISVTDVSLWLWRLVADRVDRAPACPVGEDGHYTFDSLGRDLGLAVIPAADAPSPPLSEIDVPMAVTRSALRARLEDLYGPGRSLCVYLGREAVPRSAIVVGDVRRHRRGLQPEQVCLDPERGRIAFPERYPPEQDVLVSCARLGIGAIGGGSYARPQAPAAAPVYRVGARAPGLHRTIGGALDAWRDPKKHGGPTAVIEIVDDGVYRERLEIELACGESLEIRAAVGCRPILVALERDDARRDRLRVTGPEEVPDGESAPTVTFDGIWVARHPVALHGRLGAVTLRHCTLVPAGGLAGGDDGAERRRAPSLVVRGTPDSITVCWSVLGRILAESREVGTEPVALSIADSVLDASDLTGAAIHGADDRPGWVCAELARVTVLGAALVHSVSRVEDSLITGSLECERRQTGELRHSHVGPGSRTPRRTLCPRATPRFDATDFGAPAYARLSRDAPPALRRGAHDEGELGAYHDRWETLRIDDLRTQLRDYAPVGIDIDIRLAS